MSHAFTLGWKEALTETGESMSNESLICMMISRLARSTQVDCLKVGVVAQGVEGLLCKPEDLNLAPKD